MRKDHALQRISLELQLETTPHDSRFSNQLLSMMQKEEVMQRDGTGPSLDLIRKTDEMLGQETHKFFSKTTSSNIRRWNALDAKLTKERDRLKSEIQSSTSIVLKPLDNAGMTTTRAKAELTEEDLDEEAARLEEDYNRNWLEYEGFSLREAFKSQKVRVDSEWAVHENAILEEYLAKKNELTGKSFSMMTPSSPTSHQSNVAPDSGGRWQHPEKQKTLIHTAPVLSPTSKKEKNASSSGSGSGSSGSSSPFALSPQNSPKRGASAAVAAELEKLDQSYQLSKMSLDRQKAGAVRWMSRQQIRLLAQAEEVSAERQVISSIIGREIREFAAFEAAFQNRQG